VKQDSKHSKRQTTTTLNNDKNEENKCSDKNTFLTSQYYFSWDNAQYERFIAYRNEAIIDLIARIKSFNNEKNIKSILDLGCGGGNSTNLLNKSFKNAKILGLDNDSSMLEKADKLKLKNTIFKKHDINEGLASFGQFDMIFANASIQWIKDQERLFKGIFNALNKNGIFAAQIPNDDTSPFYKALRKLLCYPKWVGKFNKSRTFYSLNINQYYEILAAKTDEIYLWECSYFHILDGLEAIIEWYKGSGLRAYLAQLESSESLAFLDDLKELLPTYFTLQKNGKVLFNIPRFFMFARI